VDDRLAEMGMERGVIFPFNRVEIEVSADPQHRGWIDAAFADYLELTSDVAARITAAGMQPPPDLTVDVRSSETGRVGGGYQIKFARVQRRPPRIRLAVLRGQAPRKSYVFCQELVCIGRGEEVTDATGRLLRRNDLPFSGGTVSRRHARVYYDLESAAFFAVDEHSSKGTRVCRGNTVRAIKPGDPRGVRLESGDELWLGDAVLLFKILPSGGNNRDANPI
jgi:hypothetical protein